MSSKTFSSTLNAPFDRTRPNARLPPQNLLDAERRTRLLKKSRKLGRVLGTATTFPDPHFATPTSSTTWTTSRLPLGRALPRPPTPETSVFYLRTRCDNASLTSLVDFSKSPNSPSRVPKSFRRSVSSSDLSRSFFLSSPPHFLSSDPDLSLCASPSLSSAGLDSRWSPRSASSSITLFSESEEKSDHDAKLNELHLTTIFPGSKQPSSPRLPQLFITPPARPESTEWPESPLAFAQLVITPPSRSESIEWPESPLEFAQPAITPPSRPSSTEWPESPLAFAPMSNTPPSRPESTEWPESPLAFAPVETVKRYKKPLPLLPFSTMGTLVRNKRHSAPPTPTTPLTPVVPSEAVIRQRRMDKLERHLGQGVPVELIFHFPGGPGMPMSNDASRLEVPSVSRSERRQGWSGEWNQPDMAAVMQKLRLL